MANDRSGERHGDLTLLCKAQKEPNGYLHYYWCKCEKCGNLKRFRYDQARRAENCGFCEDFIESQVLKALQERK